MSQKLVPVYRMHQRTLSSPCLLADPCATCARHKLCHEGRLCGDCRRGVVYECDLQAAAKPAFTVKFRHAIWLVQVGLAAFVHHKTALRLTFDRLGNLRDLSCKVDPAVIFDYTCGVPRPRLAVNYGWDTLPEVTLISQLPGQEIGFLYRLFA